MTLGGAQAADYSLSNPTETTIANITQLAISGNITAAGQEPMTAGPAHEPSPAETLTGVIGLDDVSSDRRHGHVRQQGRRAMAKGRLQLIGVALSRRTSQSTISLALRSRRTTTTANVTPLANQPDDIAAADRIL